MDGGDTIVALSFEIEYVSTGRVVPSAKTAVLFVLCYQFGLLY